LTSTPRLTRNNSLPELGVLQANKKKTEKIHSRSREGKSPRRATRETVRKSPQSSLRDSTKSPPKQQGDLDSGKESGGGSKDEKATLELPELKANNERQQKIIDVWLKFSEIYKITTEILH